MKKYDALISLEEKRKELDELVLKKGFSDKEVLKLSKEIDKLHNNLIITKFEASKN